MFVREKIGSLEDYFKPVSERNGKCVYFGRLNGFNNDADLFIKKYYDAALKNGVVVEGNIPNPTEKNLSFYYEILGQNFKKDTGFISSSLKKWLPRMNSYQNTSVSAAIYNTLDKLEKSGKSLSILKNIYIKFMCWLYYKFESTVSKIDENNVPKILYEGAIGNHELLLVSLLSDCGCDVVLLQYGGDDAYLKLDPRSEMSDEIILPAMTAFPDGYCIKKIRADAKKNADIQRLLSVKPEKTSAVNVWVKQNVFDDVLTDVKLRGSEKSFFYNCFYKLNGVEDKLTYMSDLYRLQADVKGQKRNLLIINGLIPVPANDEINAVRRGNYSSSVQMIGAMSANINYPADIKLQRLMARAFDEIMLDECAAIGDNINKQLNRAVNLLCWLKRYQNDLFKGRADDGISCFFYMGACKSEGEAAFIRMLAKLPVDVVIFNPSANEKCLPADKNLLEINYPDTMEVEKYPCEDVNLHLSTVAHHAERELDTIMYSDSGIYRSNQYSKASALILETMYEEISILWNQELKLRPNFRADNGTVDMPVIFAKISGVPNKDLSAYWVYVKSLMTEDTYVVLSPPLVKPEEENPFRKCTLQFLEDGKLQRELIKSHRLYQYGYLREEMQEHILDKMQLLIDSKLIAGTPSGKHEYDIIAAGLNINVSLIRLIQRFDFTKKNPKLIYINTSESMMSLDDSIIIALLNLIGFDILFFIPTGYRNVENNYSQKTFSEHQIGEYIYDLTVPNFSKIVIPRKRSLKNMFRRNNS